jgi:accessory Sec system protein Asp3
MNEKTIYMITWGDMSSETYLYGAHIEKQENCIVYMQEKMPPGSIVKTWVSQTNYQAKRLEPSLPILRAGHHYHLHAYMRTKPLCSSYLRLNFYDEFGEMLNFRMESQEEWEFDVPLGMRSYDLQLIRGNSEKIVFERVDLYEKSFEDHFDESNALMNILVLEPQGEMLKVPDQAFLDKLGPYILVPARSYSEYLSYIFKHRRDYKKIRLIGYGPSSNALVKKLKLSFVNAEAYVFGEKTDDERFISYGAYKKTFAEKLSDQTKHLYELPFLEHE